jgi:hypothetical protein
MADMGGFSFDVMPQDYSYVMPNQGMANQSFDWSQPSFASMPDFGGFQSYSQPQQSSQQPSYSADVLSSQGMYSGQPDAQGYQANPQAPFSQDQTFAPSTGQATGSSGSQQASSKDDDWKKMLLKMGLGAGTSALGTGLSAGLSALMAPGPAKSSQMPQMPQAPSSAIPAAAPLQSLPGTQASPLISGRPTGVQQSIGLQTQDRMRRGGSTGGLQLF